MIGTYMMDLDKIKILALNRGMSLSGLCENAGMSRSRATGWKHKGVSPKTVYKVALVLGVKPEEIIKKQEGK